MISLKTSLIAALLFASGLPALDRPEITFKDESITTGKITAWKWDFGDGASSTLQHPTRVFAKLGNYLTILEVTTAERTTSRRSKVWDVQLR